MSSCAPICLFVYNRPDHTRQTVESLKKNQSADQSDLIIYADGPKKGDSHTEVSQVREYIKTISGFKSITIIEQHQNQGLGTSIIQGVTEVVNKYGRVIVLEDDLVVSPYFLEYMNTALEHYAEDEQVMQISGYMFPVDLPENSRALFLRFTTSWGWATWQSAWQYFDETALGYAQLKKNRKLRREFDLGNAYPYFSILEKQINGKVDSWAIRWYLSVFMRHGLTLCPPRTLVQNIGFDGSGVHCGDGCFTQAALKEDYLPPAFPEQIIPSESSSHVAHALRGAVKRNFLQKLKDILW